MTVSEKVKTHGSNIYFYDSIDASSILSLNIEIDKLTKEHIKEATENKLTKVEPIYLFISSPGGNLCHSISGYNKIKYNSVPIITILDGESASGASLLFIAGFKRYIFPASTLLVHQIRGWIGGTYSDIHNKTQNLVNSDKILKDIYLKETKITEDEIDQKFQNELFWNSDEIIKYGFADKIITNVEQLKCKNPLKMFVHHTEPIEYRKVKSYRYNPIKKKTKKGKSFSFSN